MAAPPESCAWYVTPRPVSDGGYHHPKTTARDAAVASRLHGAIEKTQKDNRQFYVAVHGQPGDLNKFNTLLRESNIGTIELAEPPADAYIVEYIAQGIIHIKKTVDDALRGGPQSSENPHPETGSVPDTLHSSVRSFVAAAKARDDLRAAKERHALEMAALRAENERLQAELAVARAPAGAGAGPAAAPVMPGSPGQ